MDAELRERLREALLIVTALKDSMELALRSDPNAVWRHMSYKQYMRKYNQVLDHLEPFLEKNLPLDRYALDNLPDAMSTVAPQQKMYFESVHANVSILEAYLSAKLDLKSEQVANLRTFIEANLRKVIFVQPDKEVEIQDAIEGLLVGRSLVKGIDYNREVGRVKISIKESVPDFIFPKLSLALEVKLAKLPGQARRIVDEINADIASYATQYASILFVVYDLGTIRDAVEFRRDLEAVDGVEVIVVKH